MICRADARLLRQVDTHVSRETGLVSLPPEPRGASHHLGPAPAVSGAADEAVPEPRPRRSRLAFGSTTQRVQRRTHVGGG